MTITYKTYTKVFIKEINRVIEEFIENDILPEITYARIEGSSNRGEEELLVIESEINGQSISVKTDMRYLFFLYKEREIAIFDIISHILEEYLKGLAEGYSK